MATDKITINFDPIPDEWLTKISETRVTHRTLQQWLAPPGTVTSRKAPGWALTLLGLELKKRKKKETSSGESVGKTHA